MNSDVIDECEQARVFCVTLAGESLARTVHLWADGIWECDLCLEDACRHVRAVQRIFAPVEPDGAAAQPERAAGCA